MIKEIRKSGVRGFSLVELMIVVAILAVLAALAVPSVRDYIRNAQGRDVARSVANSFRFARDQATSRGQVVLVELTADSGSDNGTVRVLRLVDNSSSGGGDAGSTDAGSGGGGTVALPKSCKEAAWKLEEGDLTTEEVYAYDVALEQPEMAIRQIDPQPTTPLRVCAMPDGRIGSMKGLPLSPTSASAECDEQELRIGVAFEDADISTAEFGSKSLAGCVEDDPSADPNPRQDQRDSRDLVNYWMITVSYNGSVDASQ